MIFICVKKFKSAANKSLQVHLTLRLALHALLLLPEVGLPALRYFFPCGFVDLSLFCWIVVADVWFARLKNFGDVWLGSEAFLHRYVNSFIKHQGFFYGLQLLGGVHLHSKHLVNQRCQRYISLQEAT